MDLTKTKAFLNGQDYGLPENWREMTIEANFQEEAQPDLTIQNLSFVHEARKFINKWVEDGFYYEGIPFDVQLKKGKKNYLAFEGLLDLQHTLVNLDTDRATVDAVKLEGLTTFSDQLSSVTYGYLDSLGIVNSEKVEYVVEKRIPFVEQIVTLLMIYLMIKELAEIERRIEKNIIDIATIIAGGGLTGQLGAIILLAGQIVVDTIYAGIMIKAIIELGKEIFNNFLPLVKKYAVCSFYELMRASCQYLGYDFESSITQLNNFHFLPSNPNQEKILSGVPSVLDVGYNVGDFWSEMRKMFSANISIVNGTVHFENRDSDFWIKTSTYRLPSVHKRQVRKNGDELIGTRILSYASDSSDDFTIQDKTGKFYEIKTTQKTFRNGDKYQTIDAVDDRAFPWSLVSRKDRLNNLEKTLKELGKIIDKTVKLFGGNSNLEARVQSRVGMIKMGTDSHTVARVMYLQNGKLPVNHRDLIGCKLLYDNFVKADSFVLSEQGGQKVYFENVRIGFGFEDFLKLVENSYFVDDKGNEGKVTRSSWNIDGDFAELDFWIKDPNPTDNLQETYIQP